MNRYRVIKVEDTKESLTNALKELHEAMMKGSGIGFDLRKISKEKQALVMSKMDDEQRKHLKPKRIPTIFR